MDKSDDQRRKAHGELDVLLQEGINSGPSTPMTATDWNDIRSEVGRQSKEQVTVELPASAKPDISHF